MEASHLVRARCASLLCQFCWHLGTTSDHRQVNEYPERVTRHKTEAARCSNTRQRGSNTQGETMPLEGQWGIPESET